MKECFSMSLQIPHWFGFLIGLPFLAFLIAAILIVIVVYKTGGVKACFWHKRSGFLIASGGAKQDEARKRLPGRPVRRRSL